MPIRHARLAGNIQIFYFPEHLSILTAKLVRDSIFVSKFSAPAGLKIWTKVENQKREDALPLTVIAQLAFCAAQNFSFMLVSRFYRQNGQAEQNPNYHQYI
ncbi:MAG: hypothetical protein HYT98_02930 [Candidatus Sungbacteria bacterium]|nr:hypothetical protein [Candidatus Sungbacteria bacterium]